MTNRTQKTYKELLRRTISIAGKADEQNYEKELQQIKNNLQQLLEYTDLQPTQSYENNKQIETEAPVYPFCKNCHIVEKNIQLNDELETANKKSDELSNHLEENMERMSLVASVAKVGIWYWDLQTNKIVFTKYWTNILGYNTDEIEHSFDSWLKICHKNDRDDFRKMIENYTPPYGIFEVTHRLQDKNGTYRWIQSIGSTVNDLNNTKRFFGISSDITEKVKAENEIKQSEEQFRLISENVNDLIWQIDTNLDFKYISPSVNTMLGIDVAEFLRKPIDGFLSENQKDAIKDIDTEHTRKGKSIIFEKRIFATDGSFKWFEDKVSPLFAIDKLIGYHGVSRDITERKKIEFALKKAIVEAKEANQAKSEFLANISHEIRTPLNAIMGFADILSEKLKDDHDSKSILNYIQSSGNNLLRIISDLLDLSKIEAGKLDISPESIDLYSLLETIEETFKISAQKKHLNFYVSFSRHIAARIYFDELRLKQILYNLVSNAIKFTHSGFVKLVVFCSYSKDKNKISLSFQVHDTGIGIPEEQQKIIFEPFRQREGQLTRKYEGTGLGLAITKRLVSIMNGSMHLYSVVDKGSIFDVSIPDIDVVVEQRKESSIEIDENTNYSNICILIISDSETVAQKFTHSNMCGADITICKTNRIAPLILHYAQFIIIDFQQAKQEQSFVYKIKQMVAFTPVFMVSKNIEQQRKKYKKLINRFISVDDFLPKNVLQYCSEYIEPHHTAQKQNSEINKLAQDIDKELSKKLPEAIKRLSTTVMKRWKLVNQYDSFTEYNNFANLLHRIGVKYSLGILTKYADEILKYNRNFDVDNLKIQLDKYPEIVKQLKELLNKYMNYYDKQ